MGKHSDIYTTTRWRKTRAAKLRADPLCWYCLQRGVVRPADTVDHITPHRGDDALMWAWDNLQSLCSSCHNSLKQQQEIHGYHGAVGVDGLPIDENHPWRKNGKV